MKYRYLKNLKDKKAKGVSDIFSVVGATKPAFKSKADFRKWCSASTTEHVFYSMCEGDNPNVRISSENPVNKVSGIVADFDAPVDWDVVDNLITAQCKDMCPTWRSKTQSGYIRLVWEFEATLPIAKDLYDAFVRKVATHVGIDRVFAGFDEASYRPNQYFELGEDWKRIGAPLKKEVYTTCLIKVVNKTPPQTSGTAIPLEVIETEVHKKFPDRWEGDFVVGARGPLFWIDDGIDRIGCEIVEEGVVCYSDRAGRGFMSWKDLFGAKFVK